MTKQVTLIHPRYWPTWIALGVLRAFEPLPYPLLLALGRALGALLVLLPISFVRVARKNIALCLPERTEEERERILRAHFQSVGIGIFETRSEERRVGQERSGGGWRLRA